MDVEGLKGLEVGKDVFLLKPTFHEFGPYRAEQIVVRMTVTAVQPKGVMAARNGGPAQRYEAKAIEPTEAAAAGRIIDELNLLIDQAHDLRSHFRAVRDRPAV